MEQVIQKLSNIDNQSNECNKWNEWTPEERKKLLEIYLIISKKESHIFELIYHYHGCDSWEDIFRDYDISYLQDKADGVEIALNEFNSLYGEKENAKENEKENK